MSAHENDAPFMTERRLLLMGLLAAPSVAEAAARPAPAAPGGALYEEAPNAFGGKNLEQRVRELIDREELRELIARYAHRVAHGVSPASLFTEDGMFITRYSDRPNRESHGRAALDKRFADIGKNPDRSLPMIHNHLIRIDGDSATGLCSNEVRMVENGVSMIGSGYYEDQFRREKGQWKFVVRDMTFFHDVPLKEGWAKPAPR